METNKKVTGLAFLDAFGVGCFIYCEEKPRRICFGIEPGEGEPVSACMALRGEHVTQVVLDLLEHWLKDGTLYNRGGDATFKDAKEDRYVFSCAPNLLFISQVNGKSFALERPQVVLILDVFKNWLAHGGLMPAKEGQCPECDKNKEGLLSEEFLLSQIADITKERDDALDSAKSARAQNAELQTLLRESKHAHAKCLESVHEVCRRETKHSAEKGNLEQKVLALEHEREDISKLLNQSRSNVVALQEQIRDLQSSLALVDPMYCATSPNPQAGPLGGVQH